MLNSDGSVTDTNFGFGGLIRDDKGETIICYNGRGGMNQVLEQELRGMLEGVRLARDLKLKRIAIASDSKSVVEMVTEKCKGPWQLWNLVKELNKLSKEFDSIRIKHTYRESNGAADWIAKRRNLGSDFLVSYIGPLENELINVIENDVKGTWYQRLR